MGNSMNIYNSKRLKRMTSSLTVIIITYFMVAFGAFSNAAKDKELIIDVDPNTQCAVFVGPSENESNCAILYPSGNNPCKNDPECVCSKKEKYISWQTSNGAKFDIHFTEGSPFKKCNYNAERNSEIRCKIKNQGDYYYEINVEGCATNPYDPRIVVK